MGDGFGRSTDDGGEETSHPEGRPQPVRNPSKTAKNRTQGRRMLPAKSRRDARGGAIFAPDPFHGTAASCGRQVLLRAFNRLRRAASARADRMTAVEYEQNLETNTTAQRILNFYVKAVSGTRAITQFHHHRTYGDRSWTSKNYWLLNPNSISSSTGSLPLFGWEGNQVHARRFVEGLLHRGERRNAENIAEAIDGAPVRSLQAFITTGSWADHDVLGRDASVCVERSR